MQTKDDGPRGVRFRSNTPWVPQARCGYGLLRMTAYLASLDMTAVFGFAGLMVDSGFASIRPTVGC